MACHIRQAGDSLFGGFGFDRPGRIKSFDCRPSGIHTVTLVQMKWPVFRFLKSGFCARFFFTENKNLHGNRRYRFSQFIHVSASENALETFVQLMTEVM